MANIAVYLTGSIAAYKGIEVVRGLQKKGHLVRVAMTKNATQLVSPQSLYALTHQPVLTDLWQEQQSPVPHIELADWSDLALVVPATANVIAKMANGIADDAVSTSLLASSAPKIVVPAMNNHMWQAAATQRNLKTIQADGVHVLEPVNGPLAEGYSGKGCLPEPAQIVQATLSLLSCAEPNDFLQGKKVLITAGGTQEPLDPVRFIGNHSSGKMGLALAQAAIDCGAQVTLIAGQVSVPLVANERLTIQRVQTSAELLAAVKNQFAAHDVLIMAAAVADFRAQQIAQQKIKKQPDQDELIIHLTKTTDILKTVAAGKRDDQLVVGFAAETTNLLQNADQKLQNKHADMIVANRVSGPHNAFNNDQDQVTILEPGRKPQEWPLADKKVVAHRLLELISQRLAK